MHEGINNIKIVYVEWHDKMNKLIDYLLGMQILVILEKSFLIYIFINTHILTQQTYL